MGMGLLGLPAGIPVSGLLVTPGGGCPASLGAGKCQEQEEEGPQPGRASLLTGSGVKECRSRIILPWLARGNYASVE